MGVMVLGGDVTALVAAFELCARPENPKARPGNGQTLVASNDSKITKNPLWKKQRRKEEKEIMSSEL